MAEQEQKAAVSGKEVGRAIGKRKYLVVGITGVSVFISMVLSLTATPLYTARGKLGFTGNIGEGMQRDRYIKNQTEVIMSDKVARRVVQKLNLQKDESLVAAGSLDKLIHDIVATFKKAKPQTGPKDAIGDAAGRILDPKVTVVAQMPFSDLLTVSVTTDERDEAAAIANAIMEIYTQVDLETKREQLDLSLSFLDEELKEARIELSVAENDLTRFKEKYPQVGAAGVEVGKATTNLEDLKTRRLNLDLEKTKLLDSGLTKEHPSVVKIDNELTALQTQIDELNKKVGDLPVLQLQLARLDRVVRAKREIYEQLYQNRSKLAISRSDITSNVQVVDKAALPGAPISPKPTLAFIGGLFGGVIMGLLVAFIMTYIDKTVKGPNDVDRHAGVRVLATLSRKDLQNYFEDEVNLPEEYRSLRTAIMFNKQLPNARVISIAATDSVGQNAQLVTANLAIAFSLLEDRKVIAVDANLREPKMHELVGKDLQFGFADYAIGAIDNVKMKQTAHANLSVITVGQIPNHPSEAMASRRVKELLDRLRPQADYVLLNSSALKEFPDSAILGPVLDATIIVVDAEQDNMADVTLAVEKLRSTGSHILGAVVTTPT